MAQLTYKALGGLSSNQYQLYCVEINFDGTDSYVSGGVEIPFKGFTPTACIGAVEVDGTATYAPVIDFANKKLKLFASGSETSGTISASKFHLSFIGLIG